jgi:hypothetical protein
MAKLSTDLRSATLHPREAIFSTAALASNGAETIIVSDGCATVTIDLRGTFSMTIEVAGTVDGTNWIPIPVRPVNVASVAYVASIVGTTAGMWVGQCAGYRQVRARVTAYTSGSATTVLAANNANYDNLMFGPVTSGIGTITAASGAAATLTLASPGAGLRHYLTYLSINRYAAAVLTASATPVVVTTTNLPGSLAFTVPADAAALGTIDRWREDFAFPIASSAQGTATTIVAPVATGVIWRITAGFYVAP